MTSRSDPRGTARVASLSLTEWSAAWYLGAAKGTRLSSRVPKIPSRPGELRR